MKANKLNTVLSVVIPLLVLFWSLHVSAAEVCTSDTQCDDGLFCNGAEQCLPADPRADVKGCVSVGDRRTVCPPDTGLYSAFTRDYCDEDSDLCRHEQEDTDGDGHSSIRSGGDDCNDKDANSYPGNVEICDDRGKDEDCNPQTVGRKDSDGDGYTDMKCYNISPSGLRIYDNIRH